MPDFLPESYPTDNPTYTTLPDGTVLGSLTKEVRATRMNDFEVPIWFNITEDFDTHFGPVMPLVCVFLFFFFSSASLYLSIYLFPFADNMPLFCLAGAHSNNICAFATFSSRMQSWSRPYHVYGVDCHTGTVRWSLPYQVS